MTNATDFQAKLKPLEQLAKTTQLQTVEILKADVEATHTLAESLQKALQPSAKTNAFQAVFEAYQTFGQSVLTQRTRMLTDVYQSVSKLTAA